MLDLIKKDILTKEELEELDYYFENDRCDELFELDNETIIGFIDKCYDILGYCLTTQSLEHYLSFEAIDAKLLFDENTLDYYNKILEISERLSFYDYGLGYSIGDYYYNNDNIEEAMKYYKKVFVNGFDLCAENYYDSLVNYLRALNKNPSEELKALIQASPRDGKYSYDFTNVYLLLIINLEKFSSEYLAYINEAIDVTTVFVRDFQSKKSHCSFSDSPEERNLCELLALKMEYYVEKKEYIKSFELYKQLTHEIGLSDCTRYYHARSKFYRQMLEYMSEDYPELNFFEDIGYCKFRVLDAGESICPNDIITLEKKDGLTFKFKVQTINDDEYIINPILPLFGEGELIFTRISIEDGNVFLTNVLNH